MAQLMNCLVSKHEASSSSLQELCRKLATTEGVHDPSAEEMKTVGSQAPVSLVEWESLNFRKRAKR